jgi:hypothetical protein
MKQVHDDTRIKADLPDDVFVPMPNRMELGYLLYPLSQTLWLSEPEH